MQRFGFRRPKGRWKRHSAQSNPESLEWYEYAINRLLDLRDRTNEGLKALKKGKAEAKRKLAQKNSPQQTEEKPHEAEDDWAEKFKKDLDL